MSKSMAKDARRAACLVALGAALGLAPMAQSVAADAARDYPNRPVRLVVPAAAGGGTDIIARLIAQQLSDAWGQSVVVDNRGGGGGTVGITLVAKAAPDGYSMLLGSVGHLTFTPVVRTGLAYDTQKDLAPIALAANQPFLIAVHPTVPAKSVKEFLALAKSRPGQVKYGSGGSGSASHLGIALLEHQAGVQLLHVAYKGSSPALVAVMGGEIEMALAGLATILPHAKSGKVRALAVTGANRAQVAPDIPTVAEAGVPGYAFDVWYGFVYTGGTPRAIIAKANAEIVRALKSAELNRQFTAAGLEALSSTPEEFRERIASETASWRKVVKAANIRVE